MKFNIGDSVIGKDVPGLGLVVGTISKLDKRTENAPGTGVIGCVEVKTATGREVMHEKFLELNTVAKRWRK